MTNNESRINPSAHLQNVQANRLCWLWLLIGFILLPFTTVQTVIPLAAWPVLIFVHMRNITNQS